MHLEFDIDFESEEVRIIVNNSIFISASRDSDGEIIYKRFDKLESEELQEHLKQIVKQLLSIEEI